MKVLAFSAHDLKSGHAAMTRVQRLLGAIADHVGPENLHWLNLVPAAPSDWRAAGRRARQFPLRDFGVTFIRQPEIPVLKYFIRRLMPVLVLAWVWLRYRPRRDLVIWAEVISSVRHLFLVRRLLRVPFVVDVHGTIDEVLQFDPPTSAVAFRYARWVFLETRALFAASGMIGVSERMFEIYRSRYATLPPHTAVIPCVAPPGPGGWDEDRRAATRRRLDVDGRFVFAYAGGVNPWQCLDEMLAVFARCRTEAALTGLRPLLVLLVWSPERPYQPPLAAAGLSPNDVHVASVPQAEVADYLLAADAGFILRRNLTTNLVSSPTKAAEYLQAGLPIICSPYVGDVSAIVAREQVGHVVDVESEIDAAGLAAFCARVYSERRAMAERCIAVAAASFGPSHLAKVGAMLERVAAEASGGR